MVNVTSRDYDTILKYYNMETKIPLKEKKELAQRIMAEKLCKCIKKVDSDKKGKNERDNIAICRKSIFLNRKLDFYKFNCKKRRRLLPSKKGKIMKKTAKKIKFRKKKTRKNIN